MGNLCGGTNGKAGSDSSTSDDDTKVKPEVDGKLLILGAGASGKSTLFRQLVTNFGEGFGEDERKLYKDIVRANAVQAMKTLVTQSQFLLDEGIAEDTEIEEEFIGSRDFFNDEVDEKDIPELNNQIAGHIKALWKSEGIQATYFGYRSKYQMECSAEYFFNKIDDLASDNYCPSEDDVLRMRKITIGVTNKPIKLSNKTFTLVDVGGQRSERGHWEKLFANVTALIFVAAISEYDEVLYEDESTYRMEETLGLFSQICNSAWFKDVPIILLLNKVDLFVTKLRVVPLSLCFEDYLGENTPEEAKEFLKETFEGKVNRPINTYFTCAVTAEDVKKNVNMFQNVVLKASGSSSAPENDENLNLTMKK